MLGLLVRSLRRLRRRYIADTFIGLPFLRRIYCTLAHVAAFLPLRGVPVNIGGLGYFRIEPQLVFGRYDYEMWGDTHNSGFRQWVEACRGQRVVFDIGAHIGLYALPASRVMAPGGRLYAFEPGERNGLALRHHLSYNRIQNVEVFPYLVGERDALPVPFFEQKDTVEGTNSILKEKSPPSHTQTCKQQVSLDSFCLERGMLPTVMKIDVEGGELRVLKGGRELLKKYHPTIFLSIHPRHLELLGESVEELHRCIQELDYRVYDAQGREVHDFVLDEYLLKFSSVL